MSQPIAGNESFSNINTIADQLPFVNAAVASLGSVSVDNLLVDGVAPASVSVQTLTMTKNTTDTNYTVVLGTDTAAANWETGAIYLQKIALDPAIDVSSSTDFSISCADSTTLAAAAPDYAVLNVYTSRPVLGSISTAFVVFTAITGTSATFDQNIAITQTIA